MQFNLNYIQHHPTIDPSTYLQEKHERLRPPDWRKVFRTLGDGLNLSSGTLGEIRRNMRNRGAGLVNHYEHLPDLPVDPIDC